MSALYVTNDLMFSSRVTGTAREIGAKVTVSNTAAAAVEQLDKLDVNVVFIDLGTPQPDLADLVSQIRTKCPQTAIVAYGPHVREDLLQAAGDAGCDVVLTQGQFNGAIRPLLEKYCAASDS